MKHFRHLSPAAQLKIIRQYKQKTPEGNPLYKLKQIAVMNEISLSTVNKLLKLAKCDHRKRGRRNWEMTPRVLKILQDYSEPNTTLEKVGKMNPHYVMIRGKLKSVPLSRQRVSKIIKRWQGHFKEATHKPRGFRPGDKVEWATIHFIVVDYYNPRTGSVIDLRDNGEIVNFQWSHQRCRTSLVEATREELTPQQVRDRYLRRDDGSPVSQPNIGAAA